MVLSTLFPAKLQQHLFGPREKGSLHAPINPTGQRRISGYSADVGQAAKEWPLVNFVIYHSALRAFLENPQSELDRFEKTGTIDWVSDLARIPEKFGVSNVYCDIGTSFAISAVTNPRFCAAMLGTLIKGLTHVPRDRRSTDGDDADPGVSNRRARLR